MFHVIYYFQAIRIYIKREAPISWPRKNYAIEPMKTFWMVNIPFQIISGNIPGRKMKFRIF